MIFSVAIAVLVTGFAWEEKVASAVAYLISMPVSFIGNRRFSFRSNGHLSVEIFRFLIVHGLNILVTVCSLGVATDIFGIHYVFGVLIAILLVPPATFLAMNFWVFAAGRPPRL